MKELRDFNDAARGALKCRIPQRLPQTSKTRPPSSSIPRSRTSNFFDPTKSRYEMTSLNNRFGPKNNTRPRSEDQARPKSANRPKEELYANRQGHTLPRSARPNERSPTALKRPPTLIRKPTDTYKPVRPVILVPVTQRAPAKVKMPYSLPDQETIKRHEDLELQSASSENLTGCNDRTEGETESFTSRSERLMVLKISWQDKLIQFETMKNDLKEQQKGILELYAAMRDTHKKMSSLGANTVTLPPADDLRIMNVAKMTPEQLLQLCAGDELTKMQDNHSWDGKTPLTIDMNKLYEMPTKLVDTCEETLAKRKQIIDWMGSLITEEKKGITMHKLSKKLAEFNAENEVLKCSLDKVKIDFLKELEEIVGLMRKGVNESLALQLRTEELSYEMSELSSQNTDLKKQILNVDHSRAQRNKSRIEELEKELKEEKCKRSFLKDRLSRSDGQLKANIERASQLEAYLEQARSQICNLERTVQQSHEQNQMLQNDFDKELNKLTESITEHTVHLEEIADAREKLQSEKEDLEKRITELSTYYNEALRNIKQEMNTNMAKLLETEKKYEEQCLDKKRLEDSLKSIRGQLTVAEELHKNALEHLQEKESQLDKEIETRKDLENVKRQLEKANAEINEHKNQLAKQNEEKHEIERSLKKAAETTEILKHDLSAKINCIAQLEDKQALLEEQLQENENKMEAYVEQLSSLKIHISQLQEDFGEFANLKDLHEMINQQRAQLQETTRQNKELADALQKKDKEIEEFNENLSEQEHLMLEREGIIKMLSGKEEEQSNIIKILRNNLELRSRADNDLTQQIAEKNTEIDSLIVNLETRKLQISNMENIILTLEDQTKKASLQRKKDQECMMAMQKKLAEYESFHTDAARNIDTPENLDSLIKILENELGSMDHELTSKDHAYNTVCKKKYLGDRKRDKLDYHEDNNTQSRYQAESEPFPTKIVMGNFVKTTYIPTNEDQYFGDNLDRKKAITNIDTQKWVPVPEPPYSQSSTKENLSNVRRPVPGQQNPFFTRNLQYLNADQQRDEKKYKMFKLAGHRL